jgi:hypothetical protein
MDRWVIRCLYKLRVDMSELKLLLVAVAMVLLFGAAPGVASACSCIAPGSPYEELQRSSLVFAGQVLSVVRVNGGNHGNYNRVTLRNLRSFGSANSGDVVVIRTATNSAACGYTFLDGGYYVVYSYESEGALWTGLCSRTAPFEDADEDLRAFRATDLQRYAEDSPRCGGPSSAAAIQSALFVVAFVLLRRKEGRTSTGRGTHTIR